MQMLLPLYAAENQRVLEKVFRQAQDSYGMTYEHVLMALGNWGITPDSDDLDEVECMEAVVAHAKRVRECDYRSMVLAELRGCIPV